MRHSWQEKMVSEIGEVVSGGTPSTQVEAFWNGEVNWITPTDLSKLNYPKIEGSKKKITKLGLSNSSANLIPAKSIVMSSRAPIGYFAIPSIEYSTNQGCKSIILNNDEDVIFHYYNFLFNVFTFKNRGEGTTFAEISKKAIEILKFQVPPLPQQKKIAQILSTCDTVLEHTEAAIAKYQALKQGMLHDLFTRGIDIQTGQLRPSYEEAPELYKETELGFVPVDWEVRDLLSITSLITDGAHFSPIPQEKGMPIGNVKDIKNGKIDYDNCTRILPQVFEELKRQNCSPKIDDVLLSKDGTIGRVVHFTDSIPIVLLSSIAIIRPNELAFPGYLATILKSEFFDKELYKLLSGSALKRITLRDIQKIKMPYPKEIEEQEIIANRIKSITDKIQTEQQTLAKYEQLKTGLMQDLLSGVVGVEGLIED